MSYRYIPQENNENFVYPNYDLAEYDDNIIHSINNNSVSGVVTSFSATSISSSAITITYSSTWYRNGAELFVRNAGDNITIQSVHMLASNQTYFKPWRTVDSVGLTPASITGQTSYTVTNRAFTITATNAGLSSYTSGTYYFEIRFVGGNSIYPVCVTLQLTVP